MGISINYDIGWRSMRSSGKRYNSLSGHAFLIGCICRKIIFAQVTSKKCSTYAKYVSEDDPPPPMHNCILNHEGLSKSMEVKALLKILVDLHIENGDLMFIKKIVF